MILDHWHDSHTSYDYGVLCCQWQTGAAENPGVAALFCYCPRWSLLICSSADPSVLASCIQRSCCLKPVPCRSASTTALLLPLPLPLTYLSTSGYSLMSISAYIALCLRLPAMSLAPIVDTFACRLPSHHTFSMASNGLYTRPVICKFCDKVFDFPTLTTDITEK